MLTGVWKIITKLDNAHHDGMLQRVAFSAMCDMAQQPALVDSLLSCACIAVKGITPNYIAGLRGADLMMRLAGIFGLGEIQSKFKGSDVKLNVPLNGKHVEFLVPNDDYDFLRFLLLLQNPDLMRNVEGHQDLEIVAIKKLVAKFTNVMGFSGSVNLAFSLLMDVTGDDVHKIFGRTTANHRDSVRKIFAGTFTTDCEDCSDPTRGVAVNAISKFFRHEKSSTLPRITEEEDMKMLIKEFNETSITKFGNRTTRTKSTKPKMNGKPVQ
jgi:hypothetical protein